MQPHKTMEQEGSPREGAPQGAQPVPAQPMVVTSPPMETPPNQTQSPQVILVVPSSQMDTQINKFAKMFVGLGNVQLIIGILEVAFNIGVNLITPWLLYTAYIGPGYWCGLFAILAGSFGIAAGETKGKCMIITFMVISIIAAVVTLGIIVTTALGISYYSYSSYHEYTSEVITAVALDSLLLTAGMVELIIAIISASLCCAAFSGKSQPTAVYPTAHYQNGSQHFNVNGQVVMATNVLPPLTQATVPVQAHPVQQPMMNVQQPIHG